MLLVLTVADIKAVGPGVWNGWKGQLLRTLYWETELMLAGGHSSASREGRVNHAREELRRALADWSAEEVDAYVQRHYPPYWLKVELPRRIAHAHLLRRAAAGGKTLLTEFSSDAFRGVTEVTVLAPDHPRLLATIAGACAAAGANIVDASIHTTTDGMALDTIFLSRAFENDEDEARRAQRVATSIEKALAGDFKITDAVAKRTQERAKHTRAFDLEPHVVLTNSWSERYTVIEVSGLDRPGLLYELTTALSKLNLNIASAHVATFGERAVDVFYVTDLTGQKVTNTTRQSAIRRNLAAVFEPADTEAKKKVAAR